MTIKRAIFIFAICLYCASGAFGARITITADYKHYDKYRDVLIAKGNVVVQGADFRIESPYVMRYFKDEKLVAMDKFMFEREGYRISGTNLEYVYGNQSGNADKIRINFGETFLGARYMTFTKDKFELYDAYFTGCNAPQSHYHFSAQQLALYPKTGLIVAYYATCWVWIAPVIPVPTFVYSAPVPKSKFEKKVAKKEELPPKAVKQQIEGIKTTQPIPEIGANPVDGSFIRQGMNWYFTPRSYAKIILSYMEKNHFGATLATNYIINNESEGELRFGSNDVEKSYYGWSHYFSFGPKLVSKSDEQWLIYDFYKPGGKYSYELEVNYSYRERPHLNDNEAPFSRVSMTPNITLRSNRKPLPLLGDPFTYYFEASYAPTVSEEVSEFETTSTEGYVTSSPRRNYYADITYKNNFGWLGDFNLMFDGSFSDYDKLGSWDRARQTASLTQNYFDRLTFEYGHVHYMLQRGSTPYMFEGYYYSPYDQFIYGLKMKAWFSEFQIKTTYNVPSLDLYDVKYSWLIGMHCYNLLFYYDLKNDFINNKYNATFNFSFELVPSRW